MRKLRNHFTYALLASGIALSACGGSPQQQEDGASASATTDAGVSNGTPSTTGVAPATADPAQAADSMASHAGHQVVPMDAGAGQVARVDPRSTADHAGHTAPSAGGRRANEARPSTDTDTHSAHAVAATAMGAGRAAQPAADARSLPGSHAMHAAPDTRSADTTHASHAMHVAPDTGRADTTHASHAMRAAPDTGSADTTHAAHAMHAAPDTRSTDTTHAMPMAGMAAPDEMQMQDMHRMWMQPLGAGWTLMGMAQAYPIVSTSLNPDDGSALDATELYLTQPAVMFNIESPGSVFTLRTTLNFEGITQEDGELTFGGWGEGFLDKRHPHTLLHEFMLSMNLWDVAGGALSVSAGKGFASYGTDDPMSRPAVKYPTNHHLSQILERWTVNGAYINRGWSVEASVFGGGEPDGPYDFSNIESFGDSWSARVARRFGAGYGPLAEWEASASYGRVREVHDDEAEITTLYNAALRHERMYSFGTLYGLIEGSTSEPDEGDGYFSLLGETRLDVSGHQPYYRIEYATRPEYAREGEAGTDEFFRYDHDAHAIGATRWLINTVGYGYELTGYPVSARPFIELQYNRASAERGGIDPQDLFGRRNFWGLTAGFRVHLGGDPMRMGMYGVLDAMTAMHRGGPMAGPAGHMGHE